MVFGSIPLKHRAPSSANPSGAHGLLLFNTLSNGSKARFQILLLRTPQTGLIASMTPRTSAIEVLFFRKFIYHLIIVGEYLFSTMTLCMVMVAKLSKAPIMSTDKTRQYSLLRMELSIMFTRVDNAVSVPLVPLYACYIEDAEGYPKLLRAN